MVSRELSSKARDVYTVKRFKCKQYNDPFLIAILGRKEEVQLSKPAISMPVKISTPNSNGINQKTKKETFRLFFEDLHSQNLRQPWFTSQEKGRHI